MLHDQVRVHVCAHNTGTPSEAQPQRGNQSSHRHVLPVWTAMLAVLVWPLLLDRTSL